MVADRASFLFQQILDHMNESGVFNESDLAPFHRRVAELRCVSILIVFMSALSNVNRVAVLGVWTPFWFKMTWLTGDLAFRRHIVQQDAESGKHPPAMTKLLDRQLNETGMPSSMSR